jgi:hypothetical protein
MMPRYENETGPIGARGRKMTARRRPLASGRHGGRRARPRRLNGGGCRPLGSPAPRPSTTGHQCPSMMGGTGTSMMGETGTGMMPGMNMTGHTGVMSGRYRAEHDRPQVHEHGHGAPQGHEHEQGGRHARGCHGPLPSVMP